MKVKPGEGTVRYQILFEICCSRSMQCMVRCSSPNFSTSSWFMANSSAKVSPPPSTSGPLQDSTLNSSITLLGFSYFPTLFHSVFSPKNSGPPTRSASGDPDHSGCAGMPITLTFRPYRNSGEPRASPSEPKIEIRSGTVQMISSSSAFAGSVWNVCGEM